MDDAADDGDALCKPEDMSPSVEYVRWSDVPLQSLDVSWTDKDYLKEQQAYKSGEDDTRMLQNKVQLSTYANHIGENLHDLHCFLTTRLQGDARLLLGLQQAVIRASWTWPSTSSLLDMADLHGATLARPLARRYAT